MMQRYENLSMTCVFLDLLRYEICKISYYLMLIIAKDRYLCTLNKAFFSIMQNKTDKETLLVSKSLPVVNLNSVNHLFSTKKRECNVSQGVRLLVFGCPMWRLSL